MSRDSPRPSTRITLGVTLSAYVAASLQNEEVVMNTPLLARLPCNAPKNFWISGRPTWVLPPLCLNVDEVEPKLVFSNHAVNALIATLAQAADSALVRAAVPHRSQHVEHELLEERGRLLLHPVEQLGSERSPK
jgi:hypothetical protein